MKYKYYRFLVRSDLHRYAGKTGFSILLYHYLFEPGFRYSFWLRTCAFLYTKPVLRIFFAFTWLILRHLENKFGISISFRTKIDSGLYIGHFGGIVVNKKAVIGKNCNISHLVTIGVVNTGTRKGYPVIGDNVFIGPGAKIIGSITIGNNSAISPNSVVTEDVPENATVVAIPPRMVFLNGSQGYINKIDYPAWKTQESAEEKSTNEQ